MDERTKKEREKPEPSGGWFRFFAACQEKLPEMEPNGVINLAHRAGCKMKLFLDHSDTT